MKRIHKVVAIFYKGESVLVLSHQGKRFALPADDGMDVYHEAPQFAAIFGVNPDVVYVLPEIKVQQGDVFICYHAFLTPIPDGLDIPAGYELLDYDGFEKNQYDKATLRLLCRHFFYLPLLSDAPRSIPLEKEVADLAQFRLDCLKYYHRRVPKREREDYAALVASPSSPTRLSRAFHYLEQVYGFKGEDYLSYRDAVHQLREDIR